MTQRDARGRFLSAGERDERGRFVKAEGVMPTVTLSARDYDRRFANAAVGTATKNLQNSLQPLPGCICGASFGGGHAADCPQHPGSNLPQQHAPTREDIEFGFNYAKQMAAAQSMMNAVAANPSLASLDPTGAQAFQNLYQGLKHRKPWYRRLNDWLRGGK